MFEVTQPGMGRPRMRSHRGNPCIPHLNRAHSSALHHIWKSWDSEAPLCLNLNESLWVHKGLSFLSASFDIILIKPWMTLCMTFYKAVQRKRSCHCQWYLPTLTSARSSYFILHKYLGYLLYLEPQGISLGAGTHSSE